MTNIPVGVYLIGFWLLVWFAFAVPTSTFARRVGHPRWISYIVWFPYWVAWVRPTLFGAVPFLAEQHATAFISWVLYLIPGVIYLWVISARFVVAEGRREVA
jgi:hypothetical protein